MLFKLRGAQLSARYLESKMAHEHEVHVYNVMTSMHYDLQYGNLDLVDDGLTIAGIRKSRATSGSAVPKVGHRTRALGVG